MLRPLVQCPSICSPILRPHNCNSLEVTVLRRKELLFFMLRNICAILVIGLVLSNSFASAQTTSSSGAAKLTDTETTEARELAQRFTSHLIATNSVGRVTDEFYVKNFVEIFKSEIVEGLTDDSGDLENSAESVADGGDEATRAEKKPPLWLAKVDDELWERHYVASLDLICLMFLTAIIRDESGQPDDGNFAGFSSRAIETMRRNPHLTEIGDDIEGTDSIKSADEMRDFVATLETAESIVREDLIGQPSPLAPDSLWMTTEDGNRPLEVRLRVSDQETFGFPAGTRTLAVNLPIGLSLIMARENETLKIVWVAMTDD